MNKEEKNQYLATAAMILAQYHTVSNVNGKEYWDMRQWQQPNNSKEWDETFNTDMDPSQWDEDWKSHIDFTTEEGTKRLAVWLNYASQQLRNAPRLRHAVVQGKTIVNEDGVYYNAYWFIGKTAISYAAQDDPSIETLYCIKVISELEGHIKINGMLYIKDEQAQEVLDKIKNDITNGNYLAWIKSHADIYNVVNEPTPVNEEDW